MKGLTMDIVRPMRRATDDASGETVWTSMDCSNGGISAAHDRVTVVGIREGINAHHGAVEPLPRAARVVEPTDAAPAVVLVRRYLGPYTVWHVEPLALDGWSMAGGTYCATTDSRINQITGVYGALALHDRVER